MYSISWIDEGSFIIEDEDYGHRLCRINFGPELDLSYEDFYEIAESLRDAILQKMEKKSAVDQDISFGDMQPNTYEAGNKPGDYVLGSVIKGKGDGEYKS